MADDGGTIINPTWNTGGTVGPNLVTNGNFAAGSTGWTVTGGSPSFSGDQVGVTDGSFWQITQTITGLTAGSTYIVSSDYILGAGGGELNMAFATANPFQTTVEASSTPWTYTTGSTGTSNLLVLAGVNGTTTLLTNISVALAPGGRWIRQIDVPGVAVPEWFGAYGDNTHDDSAAINAAITWAELFQHTDASYGPRGSVQGSAGKMYLCNEQLGPIDPNAISKITGFGSALNFTNCSTSPCVLIAGNNADAAPYANSVFADFEGFQVLTDGKRQPARPPIQVNSTVDSVAQLSFEHLAISGFNVGLDLSNYSYAITLRKSNIFNCNICYQMINNPTDSGELMVIENCALFNSGLDVYFNNGGGELWINNSSLDYSNCMVVCLGGLVRLTNCHLETNISHPNLVPGGAQALFNCAQGDTEIRFENCALVWTSINPPPWFYSAANNPFGVKIIDCVWSAGFGVGGTSLTVVPTAMALNPSMSYPFITLTNSGLTATVNDNIPYVAANYTAEYCSFANAALPVNAGQWYFSVTLDTITTNGATSYGFWIGLCQYTGTLGSSLQPRGATIVYDPSNSAHNGVTTPVGVIVPFTPTVTPGTVYWFAVDLTAQLFWFSSDNGTHWNNVVEASASPSAGTGGVNIGSSLINILLSNYPKVLYPAVSLYAIGDSVTFNFNPNTSGVTGLSGWGSPYANAFTLGKGGLCWVKGSKPATGFGFPPLIDAGNSLNFDCDFESSSGTNFLDPWFIYTDTATITSRVTGANISISVSATKPFTGLNSLAAVKAGSGAGSFACMIPCEWIDQQGYGFEYAASSNGLGTFAFKITFAQLLYYGTGGVPVFGQSQFVGGSGNQTPTTTYQAFTGWNSATPAPPWTTHVLFQFDMAAMSAGTLYIDNAQFYRY